MKGAPTKEAAKQSNPPKKFSAFSAADSKALESRYQKLLEASEDAEEISASEDDATRGSGLRGRDKHGAENQGPENAANVAVNEDYLFDVSIPQRELTPVYWLGPVYEGMLPSSRSRQQRC